MSRCPQVSELRRLEAGELSDEQAERLVRHTSSCGACTKVLEELRSEDLDSRIIRRAMLEPDGRSGGSTGQAETAVAASKPVDGPSWTIPDYERVRLCGEGAFGTVWAVRDRVHTYRAMKIIDLSRLAKANVHCRELTALEAYCRQVAPHPNLIRIFHVGMHGDLLYYTMELADDDRTRRPVQREVPAAYRPLTLEHVVTGRSISVNTAVEVVLRLLRGLARLHSVGLAHRDIKPANIVFVEGQPKLSDIGMITANLATASNVGTPEYMPPDSQMDATADTYAMGRILWELLAGRADCVFPHLPEAVRTASGQWDGERLAAVLAKAGEREAKDRFAHADQLREAIESCRLWSNDLLFRELAKDEAAVPAGGYSRYAPVYVAAINALPWILGWLVVLILLLKLNY